MNIYRRHKSSVAMVSFSLLFLFITSFGWMPNTTFAQLPPSETLPGGTLNPLDVPKYVDPLVIPPAMESVGQSGAYTEYHIAARQFTQQILPTQTTEGINIGETTVWGYGNPNIPSSFNYPAYTVETRRNEPVRVTWINDLVAPDGSCLEHLLPVEQLLHWANPAGGLVGRDTAGTTTDPYTGPVPLVTHLHGARVQGTSDGYPEAWWLPDCNNIPFSYATIGTKYNTEQIDNTAPGTAVFEYPNDQRAATLWYHDHALGITRLNVYAGLAGFWNIRDSEEDAQNLPGPAPMVGDAPGITYHEIPIVIQDRSFNEDGSFFYPDSRAFFDEEEGNYLPNPGTDIPPTWNPEFFGNMMVVNGKTWPYLEVEQTIYRFRFLNGSNSRFLILTTDPASQQLTFHQIGSDGGLLPDAPAQLTSLLMAPAERADVLVDFSNFAPGTEITLLNIGPDEPFGGGVPGADYAISDPDSTGQVMQFRVVAAQRNNRGRSVRIPTTLPTIAPLGLADEVRDLTLNEEVSNFYDAPIAAFLGTATDGPLPWGQAITETPLLGDTEVWNVINLTEDAHPIHLHLVQFQVVDRATIDAVAYEEAQEHYLANNANPEPAWQDTAGVPIPPEAWETGWKDTVIAYPGEVTRIKARFDLPGLYVWHCHILEHEDNEMMRPYEVLLANTVMVNIDILPDDPNNPFDCMSTGVMPVAILGSPTFDVATVDHTSVIFEGAWETHLDQKSQRVRHEMDVNLDGYMDLVFHFRTQETTLTCDATSGRLEAYTYDGNLIYGTDTLNYILQPSCAVTYWASNLNTWSGLAPIYTSDTRVRDIFNNLNGKVDLDNNGTHDTALDALNYPGTTPLQLALKEAVAGILNFDYFADYPYTWPEVVHLVDIAIGDDVALEALATELAQYNNTYCLSAP